MIFEDPSKKRWHRAVFLLALLLVIALGTLALAAMGLVLPVDLQDVFATRPSVRAATLRRWQETYVKPVYSKQQTREISRKRAMERKRRARLVAQSSATSLPLPENTTIAFMVRDDAAGQASLEKHLPHLDVIVPDWFTAGGPGCDLVEHADSATRRMLEASDVLVMPRLANLENDQWQGAKFSQMMRDDNARKCFVDKLVNRLTALEADGVNIDIEELTPEDSEPLLEFLVDLKKPLHARGMRLTVDIAFFDPAYDVEFIGQLADAVFMMAYDQHYPISEPGPISGRNWFWNSVDQALPRVPKDRLVVALGAYCYDWKSAPEPDQPRPEAESLAFREAMERARVADAILEFPEDIENSRFGYSDKDGNVHDVWCQDALSVWNQMQTLKEFGVTRTALWRLGTEDDTLFDVWGSRVVPDVHKLKTVPVGNTIDILGDGEVLTIGAEPAVGQREMEFDDHDRVVSARYTVAPTGFLVERRGSDSKQIVLTFDDGPDPQWTPEILKTLKSLKVPATFFIVGDQAMQYPGIVSDIDDDGHLIGNHTFSHPHMEHLTPKEAVMELNATARLIEGLTGHRSPIFRAPYNVDVDPANPIDLTPLRVALQQGYIVVGANVDAVDWKREGVDVMSRKVIAQVEQGGHIVLMHDGGGDRSQTAAALRKFVPELRRRGYEFVTLAQYMDVPQDELVQPLNARELAFAWGNLSVTRARSWGWVFLSVLFFGCTVLAIGRVLTLGVLTLIQARQDSPKIPEGFLPRVTVLVPAYNEAKVIERTIRSILSGGYSNLEVLVVDDGSTDDTGAIVQEMAASDSRIRLVQKTNGGKAEAANAGLAVATGEIVIAVDADTIVMPQAVERMVAHFADPEVTAVCGNVEVGNVHSWLTRFQAIEYVTSQNFDRRAFAVLNAVSVVPGALGAWRRESVLKVGGYSPDTLTEDADLTLTMLRAGGRIVYEPHAVGRTEAPETISGLLRQRFRWTYGTYQCLFKHRHAFFKGTMGWFGMPNMVVFQVLFAAISPIGDLVMVLSIIRGDHAAFLAGYAAFLLMDVCGSLLAFTLDGKPLRWLWMLLVQRFTYRQLMYYVSLKAMIAAVHGARHGWRKLERTGNVDGDLSTAT